MEYINAATNSDELRDAADVAGIDRNELETIRAVVEAEAVLLPETRDQPELTGESLGILDRLLIPDSDSTRQTIYAIAERYKVLAVTGNRTKYRTFRACESDSKS
ncbi:hypothetical protein [Endozoicomonas euniceicola]|uniref:PIN domain-containing protein n=1 Tax=Endozoicomonas euniceicola TaxID=1234143 RepID=A0ABY6GPS4_9GAMM|nr:hypothetical protein [Endozoicomonas euniceicola]UYM14753.1 hypothetical protein NX720_17920 [Endozoicomonas euniceicola]